MRRILIVAHALVVFSAMVALTFCTRTPSPLGDATTRVAIYTAGADIPAGMSGAEILQRGLAVRTIVPRKDVLQGTLGPGDNRDFSARIAVVDIPKGAPLTTTVMPSATPAP
ncbi:MAG: hypothetical protein ACXVQY_11830 [Actinomycetota bacterium]